MRQIFTLALLLITLLGASAKTRQHTLKVGNFSSLEVINDINVVCRCVPDSAGLVSFTCDEDIAQGLICDKSRPSKLKLMISPDFIDRIKEYPTIYVYTDMLEQVQSNSQGTVSVEKPAKCPKFKGMLIGNGNLNVSDLDANRVIGVLATGNGTLTMSGTGTDALLKLTGAGRIRAQELKADKVTCHVFGGGEMYCWPTGELVLKGLGSTRVYYKGNPDKIKKSGLGKLLPLTD